MGTMPSFQYSPSAPNNDDLVRKVQQHTHTHTKMDVEIDMNMNMDMDMNMDMNMDMDMDMDLHDMDLHDMPMHAMDDMNIDATTTTSNVFNLHPGFVETASEEQWTEYLDALVTGNLCDGPWTTTTCGPDPPNPDPHTSLDRTNHPILPYRNHSNRTRMTVKNAAPTLSPKPKDLASRVVVVVVTSSQAALQRTCFKVIEEEKHEKLNTTDPRVAIVPCQV